ncbi:MAG: hypothetical protein ACRBFS_16545 [Aureispira sp.]
MPIRYAACLLTDLDPTNNYKTVLFALQKMETTVVGTDFDQETVVRILQSIRIGDSH